MSVPTSVRELGDYLSCKERVQILMHEYDSLRNEILQRTSHMYQLWAMIVVVVGWTATRDHLRWYGWTFLGLFLLAALFLYHQIDRDIKRAADRVADIEDQVDMETGESGLLIWERCYGGRKRGFIFMKPPLDCPSPQNPTDKSSAG